MHSDAPFSGSPDGRRSGDVWLGRALANAGDRSAVRVLLTCGLVAGLAIALLRAHGHEELGFRNSSIDLILGRYNDEKMTVDEEHVFGKLRVRAANKLKRLEITGVCTDAPSAFDLVRIYAVAGTHGGWWDIGNVKRGTFAWLGIGTKLEFDLPPGWTLEPETRDAANATDVQAKVRQTAPSEKIIRPLKPPDTIQAKPYIATIEVYHQARRSPWKCEVGENKELLVRFCGDNCRPDSPPRPAASPKSGR
jgi:hypothetical protein